MLDFGFDKIALIGAVALVVVGPEKLPRIARTVGALFGKAQRYVADVKVEVNRAIEVEELRKVKTQFEDAARRVQETVRAEVDQAGTAMQDGWQAATAGIDVPTVPPAAAVEPLPPAFRHPKKNWRLKRGATPQWYKQRNGVRTKAQSAAARGARRRPAGLRPGLGSGP